MDFFKEINEIKNEHDFSLPIPSESDEKIISLMNNILAIEKEHLNIFISKNDFQFAKILCAFSERMACLAVRQNNINSLIIGLQSLYFATKNSEIDSRDIIVMMAIYYDASKRVKVKLDDIKENIFLDDDFYEYIKSFINRDEKDKTLEVVGYCTAFDVRGDFIYRRQDEMSYEDVLKLTEKYGKDSE